MTTEYLQYKRLESIVKRTIKTLKYCGFEVSAKIDLKNNVYGVVLKNISDDDFNSLLSYQRTGFLSKEILVMR